MGLQSFQMRQKFGDWAENTVFLHFKNHPESGITAVPYGERWGGKKKSKTDAVNRPDLLLLSNDAVAELAGDGIDLNSLSLRSLPDNDKRMLRILRHAIVGFETKISFRFYAKGHVNFIIDELRKQRYMTWLTQTKNVGDIVAWFTLDKAWISPMETILKHGEQIERTYETRGAKARTKMTYNLPVEKAAKWADVQGVELNKTIRASLSVGSSGSIAFEVAHEPGQLANVDLEPLLKMAGQVKRLS